MISYKLFFEAYIPNFTVDKEFKTIPESQLGLSISTKDLPEVCPYGFWVSPHGNFKVVSGMQHHMEAINILTIAEKVNPKIIPNPDENSESILYDNGYLRVVQGHKNNNMIVIYYMQYDKKFVTHAQMKFLTYLKSIYPICEMTFEAVYG